MSTPRKISCMVKGIIDHGEHVYTVDLKPTIPLPHFKPGQFLHLTVDDFDPSGFWPESRVFSIASSSMERKRLRISYSVKGKYTRKMEEALKVGKTVWIKLPYGDFLIDSSEHVFLIAGGTGISAFCAFLDSLPPQHTNRVTLVYGARSPDLHIYREEILGKASSCPHFQAAFFSETGWPVSGPIGELSSGAIRHRDGKLDLDCIWAMFPDAGASTFYLSGPPAMLSALSIGLKDRGIPQERVRTDAWE